MELVSELNNLMVKYRFRPNKKMAQLFVVDPHVIDDMVEAAELSPHDTVLEIGAGTGFLTRELQKKCRVIAVEIDDALFELLERELPSENLELVHGNFLEARLPEFNKVVALPPYTISSGIMHRLFELQPELCVLVFQKEFVEKLLAKPGFTEYNAISVLTHYHFGVAKVKRVPAHCFFPKPNADSAMVKLSTSSECGRAKNEEHFRLFVKSVFRFQNKNIENAVKNSLPFLMKNFEAGAAVRGKIGSHPLAKTKVNLLSCSDFVELFNELFGGAG
jgi:16S rRNA (adenine1518-N6/adenine1519-N6)-dimethyltransferase